MVPESTHKRGSECAQAAALAVTHPRKYHPLCLSDSATVQCSQHLAWERGLKSQRNARRQSARPDCSASRMAGGQLREGWEALAPARRARVLQSQNAPAWKESRTEFPFPPPPAQPGQPLPSSPTARFLVRPPSGHLSHLSRSPWHLQQGTAWAPNLSLTLEFRGVPQEVTINCSNKLSDLR